MRPTRAARPTVPAWTRPRLARVAAAAAASLGALVSAPPAGAQSALLEPGPTRALDAVAHSGNVLLIVADDLGVDEVGAYGVGTSPPPTPFLDAIAADGVLFRNAWSSPVCSPTRAGILTGRYALRTGIGYLVQTTAELGLDEVTLPELLDAGTDGAYAHAAIGKWHLGESVAAGGALAPNLAGFDHFAGVLANLKPPLTDYFTWEQVEDGVTTTATGYATTRQVDDALAWIDAAPEPWFCYLAFNAPHVPFHAPPPGLHSVDLSGAGDPLDDPRPYYEAAVQALDAEIGRLLIGIADLRERTTVVFVGDNGTPQQVSLPPFEPTHAKGSLYEGGVNVPLLVSGPTVVAPGRECDALVSTVDLFATVAELAGVEPADVLPEGRPLDSVSLGPYLREPGRPSRRATLFTELFRPSGLAYALPLDPLPDRAACQPDFGFQGPGTARLDLCGALLADNGSALLEVTDGPANAAGFLVSSVLFDPQPYLGGFLTPQPVLLMEPIATDGAGYATSPAGGGNGPLFVYYQALLEDPTQPAGYQITNTIRAEYLPTNLKAIRGGRYKLIDSVNGGDDRFFDLRTDPFEATNLLEAGPLSPEAAARYAWLQDELAALLASAE